jgi:hypothetical protein
MIIKRRRFKQTTTLQHRLLSFAQEARKKALILPAGCEKQDLLKKARQADTAAHLDKWIHSSGSQRPE